MATTFSRYLKPSKSEPWGSSSSGKLPSGVFAMHLTYPDTYYHAPVENWQSGVNTSGWAQGLTVLIRTPLAAASSTIADTTNVIAVDLKAAAIANPTLNFDLGSENATRMIAAKINSRKVNQAGLTGLRRYLRAQYIRQSLPHKYQVLGATFHSPGGGGVQNIDLEIATKSKNGFPSEMLNDFILRVENSSSTKNVTNGDYVNPTLQYKRSPDGGAFNTLVECQLPAGTVNGSPSAGDVLNNTFTLVGETPKHTIALSWLLDQPNTDGVYWGEQSGGPVIQGMGAIGVHRLVAKPLDGGNRGIPNLRSKSDNGKTATQETVPVGYNRFSIEGLNSCTLPELPPPDFHSIYPTIRGITTIHPDAETQAVSNNRLLIQPLEYGTEFTITGDASNQTIAFDTGELSIPTDFTATAEQAYVPTGANGVHIKNYDIKSASEFRNQVGVAGGTDVYAREFMTTMKVNEERVVGLHISNEEKVFESMTVIDDVGNELILEGGSPFGTVIRDFKFTNTRKNPKTDEIHVGPSSASGDVEPNLRIQLPKQEEIPGGIFVRSGHDRVQAWSNLSWGMGGLSPPKPEKAGFLETYGEPSSYDTHDRSLIFHCQRILGDYLDNYHDLDTKDPAITSFNNRGDSGHTRLFAAHRASDHVERGSLLRQTNNGVETGNLFPHHKIRFGRYGHSFVSPMCHRGTPQSLRRQLHRSHGAAYSLMFEAESEYKHHGFGNSDPSGNTASVFQLDSIDVSNASSTYSTGSFASDGFPLDELKGKRHFKSDSKFTSATHRSIADYLFAPGQKHTNVEGTSEFVSFAEGAIDGSITTGSATKLNLQGSTLTARNRHNTASEVMLNGFFINNYMGIGGRPEPIKVVGKDAFNNWFLRGYHEGVIRPRVATELATVPPLISHDPELLNTNSGSSAPSVVEKRDLGLAKASDTTSGGTPDAFLCTWLAEFSHPLYYGTSREFYMTFRYRESGMPRSINYPSTNGLFLRNYSNRTVDGQAEKSLPFERLYVAQWLQNYGYNALNAGGHGDVEGLRSLNAMLMGFTTLREARGTIELYSQNGERRHSRGEGIGDSLNPTSPIRVVKGIDIDADGEDLNKQFYTAHPYFGINISRRLPVRAWGIRTATEWDRSFAGDPTETQNQNVPAFAPLRFNGGSHDSNTHLTLTTSLLVDTSYEAGIGVDNTPAQTVPVGFVASDFTTEAHPFERNTRQSNSPIKEQEEQIGIGRSLGITKNGMLAHDAMAAGMWDYELDDNRPTTLPVSQPVLWLKADSLDLEDGASVSSWFDSSANKWEFTQGTASAQPSFVKRNTAFGNMPVVNCDGNDVLSTPFQEALNPSQMTLFIVAAISSDNDNYNGVIESRRTSPNHQGFNVYGNMTGSSNRWEFWYGRGANFGAVNVGDGAITVGEPDIITGIISGGDGAGATATQKIHLNGELKHTRTDPFHKATADAMNIGRVPSPFYLNGQIAEIVLYPRELTAAEIYEVEAYLSRKYGIAISTAASSSHTGILHSVDTRPINKGSDPWIDLVQESGSVAYAQQDSAGAFLTKTTATRFGAGSHFYHLRGNAFKTNLHAVNKARNRFAYPPGGYHEAEMTGNVVSRVTPDISTEVQDVRQIQSRTEPRLGLVMEVESERKSNNNVDYSVVGTRAVSLHTDKMLGYQFPVLPSHVINTHFGTNGFTNAPSSPATSTLPDFSKKPTWSPDSNANKGAILGSLPNDTVRTDYKTHALDHWAVRGVADLPAWGGVYILRKTYLNRNEEDDTLRTEVDGSTTNNAIEGKATPSHPVRKYVDYIVRPVRPLKLFGFASDILQDGWVLGARVGMGSSAHASQPFHRDKRYGVFEMNASKNDNELEPITSATSAFTIDFPDANDFDVVWHLIPSANMLQHFKSDAHRYDDDGNFNVDIEARYSQSSHPGGGEPIYQSETNYAEENGVMGDHSIHQKVAKVKQPNNSLRLYPKVEVLSNKGGNVYGVDNGLALPASGFLIAIGYKGRLSYTRNGDNITISGFIYTPEGALTFTAYTNYVGLTLYYSDVPASGHDGGSSPPNYKTMTFNDVRSNPNVMQVVSPSFVDNAVIAMQIESQAWYKYDATTDTVAKTALNYRGLMHYEPSDFVMVSQSPFIISDGSNQGVISSLSGNQNDIYVDTEKLSEDFFPPYLIDSNNIRWRIAEITKDRDRNVMVFKEMSEKSLSSSGMTVGKAIAGQFGYIGVRTTDAALHLLNDAGGSKTGVSITPVDEFTKNSRDVEGYLNAHPMLRQINDHSLKYIARDTRGLNTMEVLRNLSQLDGRQIMSEKNGTILFSGEVFKDRGLRLGNQNGMDKIHVSKLFDSPNEIVIVGDVIAGNEIVFVRVADAEKIRQAAANGAQDEGLVKTLRQQIPGIKSVAAARKLAKTLLARAENGAPMISIKGMMNATSVLAGDIVDVNFPTQGVVGKFAVFEAKHNYQSLRSDFIIGQYEKGIEGLLSDVKTNTIDVSGISQSAGDKDIQNNITMSAAFNVITVHRVRVRNVNETGFIIGARHKNGLGKIGVRDGNKRGFPIGMSKSRNYVVK